MAAPIGNQNSANRGIWRQAIIRALDKKGVSRADALDGMANKLIELVETGDLQALREFGDRLDGKAAQSVMLSGDPDGEPIGIIERKIIKSGD